MTEELPVHSLHTMAFRSMKRSSEMFVLDDNTELEADPKAKDILLKSKIYSQYGATREAVDQNPAKKRHVKEDDRESIQAADNPEAGGGLTSALNEIRAARPVPLADAEDETPAENGTLIAVGESRRIIAVPRKAQTSVKPTWHAPWKLTRVISGHGGWVRCVAVEPGNEWFATGSSDRIIKIWDMHSAQLRLSLTGHISTVRGVAVSSRHPYLFSCGEDKQVKLWDLEYNKVIKHFHGHLNGVYGLDLHPSLDILVSCGRDATARLWDMRTKVQIHCLTGHSSTVFQVRCQANEPQIITASEDSTIRLWDIVAGKTKATLTNHKKSVRAIGLHPSLNMMVTGSADNLKQWSFPEGVFIQNMSGHRAIVNALAVNYDNVVVSGADNGSLHFWDWKSAFSFQKLQSLPQPGSLDSEAGIYALAFDKSGSRLITCESDKSIKVYMEDDSATEATHPILDWKPEFKRKTF